MNKYDYYDEMGLKNEEILTAFTKSTGEIRFKPNYRNNIPDGKTKHIPEAIFSKMYKIGLNFLLDNCNSEEIKAVNKLVNLAQMNTNSLVPLSSETTDIYLSELFDVDRRRVKKIKNHLFDLGIYGEFKVKREDVPYTKYWILNPYLAFSGSLISSDIASLFLGTKLANYYFAHKKDYIY